jgi:hypothetical protein
MHRDAAQPYVWVDIRPDTTERQLLAVVVGNSGPTFATNIRATFNPPLPTGTLNGRDEGASERLRAGLPSLAPGKQLSWALGMGPVVLGSDRSRRYTITIDADGPFGPLPQLSVDVDVVSYIGVLVRPEGSLHKVEEAIGRVAAAIGSSRPR